MEIDLWKKIAAVGVTAWERRNDRHGGGGGEGGSVQSGLRF